MPLGLLLYSLAELRDNTLHREVLLLALGGGAQGDWHFGKVSAYLLSPSSVGRLWLAVYGGRCELHDGVLLYE